MNVFEVVATLLAGMQENVYTHISENCAFIKDLNRTLQIVDPSIHSCIHLYTHPLLLNKWKNMCQELLGT